MASSDAVQGFMTQMQNLGGVIVTEQPRLDLDHYIQNYDGRTRFDRLLHIGKSSVPLCVDSLKAAIKEAKGGQDVRSYKEAWECIRIAAPNDPDAIRDEDWIDRTTRANKTETARLETELKGYKNNLIKESIRMGNEDLGKHFIKIGSLNEAAEAFGRMRHDVTTAKQIIDCGLHLVNVSLQRSDWTLVLSNVGKISGFQPADDDGINVQPYVKVASGLALLGLGSFNDAAKHFLGANLATSTKSLRDIASPHDVAIYGGLLALATMERSELQTRVLDNSGFKYALEHEPHIRKAVSLFVNGRYSNCLEILEAFRPDYLLDIHLCKHVPAIFARVRSKCIKQYFAPFSCVTLPNLEAAFARTGESLEDELVSMIRAGTLEARIDSKDKLLVAVQPDARLVMQKSALEVATKYEREAKERLRRMSLIAAGLEVHTQRQAGNRTATEIDANAMISEAMAM